jgi:conserved oligomeric Golgi complex subunit 8
VPIFVKTILSNFQAAIFKVTKQFESNIENFTLINKLHSFGRSRYDVADKNGEELTSNAPPETLLDFQPLAIYCNGLLNAFNDLRLCSPIAIADSVTNILQNSLEAVCRNILSFYRQEQQAFTVGERENFIKFCSCFAYDLIPYVQRCMHLIFPPNVLATHLGINLMVLQKQMLTYLKQKEIVQPLEHLLPDRVDAVIMQQQQQQQSMPAVKDDEVMVKMSSDVAEKLTLEGN